MKILCGDCAEVMKQIESDSIDLVVTSPPYDNLRNYHSEFDINKVTQQLFRLLKQGGVVVWIVGDATIEPCILAGTRKGDTVIDCFSGSGTTGVVSVKNQRNYIGIELNPKYNKIAQMRIQSEAQNGFLF